MAERFMEGNRADRFPYSITYWCEVKVPIDEFYYDGEWNPDPDEEERKKGFFEFSGNEETYHVPTKEEDYKDWVIETLNDEFGVEIDMNECEFVVTYKEHQDTP